VRLQAVFLDLMGTVLYDPYIEALEAATGMSVADAHAVKDPDSWPQFECGAIDEAEFVRRFFSDRTLEGQFDVEAFHRVRREGYRFLPGMAEVVEQLRGRVARYVASNYPVWIDEMAEVFDFARHFDGVYASCHLGVRKPDRRFYEALLDDVGAPASACLFVDDRRANCDAAAAVGMHVHLFRDAEALRTDLRRYGVLPPTDEGG